ncbi:uncharacterized protein METZ01_LOCUS436763, partial [marine metagenome]
MYKNWKTGVLLYLIMDLSVLLDSSAGLHNLYHLKNRFSP